MHRVFILLCFTSLVSYAEESLFFPIEHNHVQILPQRFEYQLINKDLFRIGDTLTDVTQISFQVSASALKDKKSEFKLRFRWPAGLIQKGEVLIRDNSGKVIWSDPIESNNVKLKTLERKIQDSDPLRADIATYEKNDISIELLRKLQFLPFFKFCVLRAEEVTRVHLCSKDLYFKTNGESYVIQARDSFRQESYVDINGKSVGQQGRIYLQGTNDLISMRALLLSGATIEIDTRMKPVEWQDITEITDTKKLIVRAVGAEPANEKLVMQKDENGWQVELNKDRPVVYLKGEGGIPLRQEFIPNGPIRSDNLKIQYLEPPPTQTYASEISALLAVPAEINLSPTDRLTQIETQPNGQVEWKLQRLEIHRKNRRFIKATIGGKDFIAARDVYRGIGKEFSAHFNFLKSIDINWLQWLNERWGYQLAWYQVFMKGNDAEVLWAELRALYRLNSGLYLKDPTWFISAGIDPFQIDKTSVIGLTVGLGRYEVAPLWATWFDFAESHMDLSIGGSGDTVKLGYSMRLQYELKAEVKKGQYFSSGLKMDVTQISVGDTSTTLIWPQIKFGYTFLF